MAKMGLMHIEEEVLFSSVFDSDKGEDVKSRGQMIEKKIDMLEVLASRVSNRRSRRWMNDRLLIELVPRLNAEEIRGLFAPPPWGDDAPLSTFCMTNNGQWDIFRSVDMDVEARLIKQMETASTKRKSNVDQDKLIALNAWRRVDRQTREALRRSFLSDLLGTYEGQVRAFVEDSGDTDVLVIQVQDPYHRLLLHGVCEFYNLKSATIDTWRDAKLLKTTMIEKRLGLEGVLPTITLVNFLKMAKN